MCNAPDVLEALTDASDIALSEDQSDFLRACLASEQAGWVSDSCLTGKVTALALLAAVLLQADNVTVYALHPKYESGAKFRARVSLLLEKAGYAADGVGRLRMCSDFYDVDQALSESRAAAEGHANVLLISDMQMIRTVHAFGLGSTEDATTYIVTYPEDVLGRLTGAYFVDRPSMLVRPESSIVKDAAARSVVSMAHHPNYLHD